MLTNKVEERRRNVSLAELKNEKGNLSMFYEEYYTELKKTTEYNIGHDENSDNKQDYGMLNLIYRQLANFDYLSELYSSTSFFKSFLHRFGFILSDLFLDGSRSTIDDSLSFAKTKSGSFLYSLNYGDLLSASVL